jgi:hypothetical protein
VNTDPGAPRDHDRSKNEGLPVVTVVPFLSVVHYGDRRAEGAFHARPLTAAGRAAADHHPWLTGLGRGVLKIIEPLIEDFHLVIPSIPGYGFASPTRETG